MLRRYGLLILITLLLLGCQQEQNDDALIDSGMTKQLKQVKNSQHNNKTDFDNEEIAIHLSNIAGSVPNINNAVAIVAGPYAVVGIDLDKDLDGSRVGTIKYTVSEALKHDPYGKTAVVIADGDIIERIKAMGKSIRDGYPIQGVIDELSTIVSRYMPDFPTKENKYIKPDQNKDIISEDEKDNLNDLEKEHSNK